MPFINVKTNVEITKDTEEKIKNALGQAITAIPGKSEGWLMVGIEDNYKLYFRGTNEPSAMIEVSVFGNPSSNSLETLTSNITGIMLNELGIPTDRVYVSYAKTPDWGWNGTNL